ncbi:MAG: DNA primase [Verrucomicrobia bacterium]|nr:DNA primase [Verrucomicrobiota bacterium]
MAGIISQQLREQIRAASDIVDIIGAAVPLKRAGTNFVGLCPFHKEKTPSFNVSATKQMFKCFGCGKGGDVFTFVKEYESVTFPEALKRLAERARIPLVYEGGAAPDERGAFVKDSLLKLHDAICSRWQGALANEAGGQLARDYLAKRGVSAEAVKLFRLGAAPETWDDTVNWAKSKGFDLALVEQAGLIIKKEGTDHHYDRFRGRLMFPICDEQGRVIGFSGRVLAGDEKTAKYVNSPETPIFTKGKVMFGLDKSKRALLDAGFVIVCEGQLDLIACFMAGIQNIVAPQGTAFTEAHARILRRYVQEVVLCFDSDNAGQNAAVRALDDLLASGLAIRVATLPAPHDPDTYIKEFGADAMKEVIAKAEGFFDFYLRRLCTQNDIVTDRGRLAVVRAMGDAARKTGNSVMLDTCAQKTAQRLGVSVDSVRQEFSKVPQQRTFTPAPAPEAEEIPVPSEEEVAPPPHRELWLLRLVLLKEMDEHFDWFAAHFQPAWVTDRDLRHLLELRLAHFGGGTWHGDAVLMGELETDRERDLLADAGLTQRAIPEPQKQIADVLLQLRNDFIDRQVQRLDQQLAAPEMPEEEKLRAMQQRQQLRALKRSPLAAMADAG